MVNKWLLTWYMLEWCYSSRAARLVLRRRCRHHVIVHVIRNLRLLRICKSHICLLKVHPCLTTCITDGFDYSGTIVWWTILGVKRKLACSISAACVIYQCKVMQCKQLLVVKSKTNKEYAGFEEVICYICSTALTINYRCLNPTKLATHQILLLDRWYILRFVRGLMSSKCLWHVSVIDPAVRE